jgi:predicted  nucleic acid-binding Zn-ribbon protein
MVDEKYLQMSITIRRTYLKLINNLDLYRSRALQISERLEDTVKKIDELNKEAEESAKKKSTSSNISQIEVFEKLLKIIDDVDDEGKRLENLISPINKEIEKLAKEEMELYQMIVDSHPSLTEDQIVESVKDRLIKEGLS